MSERGEGARKREEKEGVVEEGVLELSYGSHEGPL
jgi:hypothetical protein